MVFVEPSFPRGRKIDFGEDTKPKKKFKKDTEYGASTKNEEKPQKPCKKERLAHRLAEMEHELEQLENTASAIPLHFKSVQKGMLLLGCVFKIQRMDMTISLPGRMYGTVPITSISEAYSRRLQDLLQKTNTLIENKCPSLNELYTVGDLVYVKVVAKLENKLLLTLNPEELHSNFNFKQIVEGMILSSTVEEDEDHGFCMNVGIKNVRAFLPLENICKNKIETGANVTCIVEKVTKSTNAATVILKAFKPNKPWKLEVTEVNIDVIVPGSMVSFTVTSILHNGLQGTLFDDTIPAYVNVNMLEKPLSKLKNYSLFKQLQARVLYTMPLTKQIFLTLAKFDANKANIMQPVTTGTIVSDAKIISKCSSGVWFQIGKKHKGLLPKYILKSKYKENYDEQLVMAKYHLNSVHKVRIIRYETFDRTLIVTDHEQALNCKYYTFQDVNVGQVYECRISKVLSNKRGYLVLLDNLKGIVTGHNFHYTKSHIVGQTIKLCLISIEEERNMMQFTNHPQYFRKSAKVIKSRENIEQGSVSLGTVIVEQEKFFIVTFFNKITGILFKYCRNVAQDQDKIGNLKLGSVCYFTIQDVAENGEKITLSLPITSANKNLGHIAVAAVTGVFATGADIYLPKTNEYGVILPKNYSDFDEHRLVYQNVLREGDKLEVVNIQENIYSRRDVDYFKRKPVSVNDVKVGVVLRAFCVDTAHSAKKLTFVLALKDYSKKISLRTREFFTAKSQCCQVYEGHVILVKVIRKIQKDNEVMLLVSPKLADVFSHGIEDVLRYMQTYISDVKDLLQRFKTRGKSFAQFTVGQEITCVVENFVEESDQIIVQLNSECGLVKGIATKDPKKRDYAINDQLAGRVLWVDVEKQLVHVCVVKKYLKYITDTLIDETTTGLFDTAEKHDFIRLFANNYVAVGCLKKSNSPLVVIPVRCHYNDFEIVNVGDKNKVVCVRSFDGLIYGLTEERYEKYKELKWVKPERKDKQHKDCWLPDNYEEALLPNPDDPHPAAQHEVEGDSHSDSGIDKGEEIVESVPHKIKIKQCKKQTHIAESKPNAVASPGKLLKIKKQKKKTTLKNLKLKKNFVINQLDGADDLIAKTKHKNKIQKPAKQSLVASNIQKPGKLEKKRKAQQLAQQTKYKKKKNKKLKLSNDSVETEAREVLPRARNGTLPGAENFWSTSSIFQYQDSSDSSGDEEDSGVSTKKRLTAKEKFEALKQGEKRIRKIEEELADNSVEPHTADQYDRLVLSQPNSSLLWIRYMAFHMESAEVEKARAVARKALKTINFREEGERLNVWVALLNLELRYETIEKFKEVLQEAVQYNDPFNVYSRVIEVLIDCGKTPEVLELIDILQKRFRKQSEMWLLVATSYYKIGYRTKVKPLLTKALKSLENREHIPLILKFAFLHNRNEERDEAHILFEQILTSYPKRTDIWSQYVDMLVKDGMVDVARQTLDRAIAQRLPMKNMKTLFTKYVNFEEKHGDRDAVKKVKQMAAEYINQQLRLFGTATDAN